MSQSRKPVQKALGLSLIFMAAVFALVATYWGWLLKDGLGPDSVPTTGTSAFVALLTGGWHLFLPAALLWLVGMLLLRDSRRGA